MKLRRIVSTLILISAVSLLSLCSAAALKYGDKGADVKEVQEYLIAQNLLHITADGVFGTETADAIKDFQSALGLEVDGVCGAETYKILRAAAYDEIDINTYKLGDFIPEHIDEFKIISDEDIGENSEEDSEATIKSVLSAVEAVVEVAQYAGVGDVIELGMQGDGVIDLQNKLIEQGFYDGEAHGVCNEETVDALKDFQRSCGIVADGICGSRTYSALDGEDSSGEYYSNDYSAEIPGGGRVVRVEATAYSRMEPGMSDYTARGNFCTRGIIATDPYVIPLGTRVFIPGYGYAVADDTGGAIIGNRIDVAFDTVDECFEFGRQVIDIVILDD